MPPPEEQQAPEVALPADPEAEAMLRDPELIRIVIDDIAALGVAGEPDLTATIYLAGTSRLLDRPLAAIVQGPSSSGKSYTVDRVAQLFPGEVVIRATELSPKALYYVTPGTLSHKFVVAGERSNKADDDANDATRALRQMLSEGRLDKLVAQTDGGLKTAHAHQDGPIAYVETTTSSNIFAEDRNRCLLLRTDAGQEQTRRILERIGDACAGATPVANPECIISKHHAAQRMLERQSVRIPFARVLADRLPSDRVEARRAINQILGMVRASTLLHQHQREVEDNHLIAQREDYELAARLLDGPMGDLLGRQIPDACSLFHLRLRQGLAGQAVTAPGLATRLGMSDTTVRGYLNALCAAGYISIEREARGREPRRYLVPAVMPEQPTRSVLPAAAELFPELHFDRADGGEAAAQEALTIEHG